ncbi:MAG: HD domain-containing protein [Phycisphaerales bacterium]|nr:HD domain-containing protein [Phycisphaerales bacterium]
MAWRLRGYSGDTEREVALTPGKVITIGRSPECSVHLTDAKVSRRHAELHWAPPVDDHGGHWRVGDCGSTSGTFLNGVKLAQHREVRLDHADSLTIEPWRFRVDDLSGDRTMAEGAGTIVHSVGGSEGFVPLAAVQAPAEFNQGLLVHLLAAHENIALADDEVSVGQAVVESLTMATGFANVAFLREGAPGVPELVFGSGATAIGRGELQLSRSVLKRARNCIFMNQCEASPGATLAASLDSLAIKQVLCVPVTMGKNGFFGWIYLDNRGGDVHEWSEMDAPAMAQAVAGLAGLSLANIERGKMQQRFDLETSEKFKGVVLALIDAVDKKDPYTSGHSKRVSEFAALLAQAAKLSDEHVRQTRECGLVHDIGKIGVPGAILRKPTRLEDHEFAQIREHPAKGAEILGNIPQMRDLLPGVLQHHERWDGKGYPNNLKGEEISQLGRILCIADCFDAMTSARVYRPARSIAEVRIEIERCLGTHFDPELGRLFLSISENELASRICPSISLPKA